MQRVQRKAGDEGGDEAVPTDRFFEAANGTIMFGWTTALIVTAAHKLYLHRDDETTTA